jgi:hypothetical protein
MMLPPSSRNGALGDQKGPRIEDEVGATVPSVTSLCAISSTSLNDQLASRRMVKISMDKYLRFETDNI